MGKIRQFELDVAYTINSSKYCSLSGSGLYVTTRRVFDYYLNIDYEMAMTANQLYDWCSENTRIDPVYYANSFVNNQDKDYLQKATTEFSKVATL